MKRTMRIGTWNVQGIASKTEEVFKELGKHNIDIAALTETKKKGQGTEIKHKYLLIYSGVAKEERGSSGVAIVIKASLKNYLKSWEQVSDRILLAEMEIKSHPIVLVAVYSPNDSANVEKKERFYESLIATLEQISDRKEIILMGDLNGRIGRRNNDPVVGQYGEDTVNDNGERLIECCQDNSLRIMNGWFQHKDIHRFTWVQSTRNIKSIIDYIIVKQCTNLKITDIRVKRGIECGSDHHFLLAKIYFPYKQNRQPVTDEDEGLNETSVKYNLQSLRDDSTKFLYQTRLAAKLSTVQGETPTELYERMANSIHEAAREALGEEHKYTQNRTLPLWWNDNLAQLIENKKRSYNQWLATNSPQDKQEYQKRRKEVQQEVKKSKNTYWDKTCMEVNNCIGNTRARKAWKVVNGMRTQNRDSAGINIIGLQQWKDYYEDLLTEQRPEFQEGIILSPSKEGNEEIPLITAQEVRSSIKQMKNGKAPGPGGLNIELLKAAPEMLMELLASIFNMCLHGQPVPPEWKQGIITSIFKKGNRRDCKNYRGINVICSVARLYGRLLKKRMEQKFRESEEQNGFRAGRSCVDGIFTIKNLIEKRMERGRSTHLVFVDLQKAYDTVPLNQLWPCMKANGIDPEYIQTIQDMYSNCTSKVKLGRRISEEFAVTKGLRQGCSLAPLLFKIYLEEALKDWKKKCRGMGIPIDNDTLFTLLFADDQILVSEDNDDANYMLRKLQDELAKWGLTINMNKTEYMIVGDEEKKDLDIGTCTIKHTDTFKYLGVTISSTGKSNSDITNKIGQGRQAIRQLNSLLWSDQINRKTKCSIYKTIVESISTYGSETWELNKRNKNKLLALEMDFWRRSCSVSRMDHIRNEIIRERMKVDSNIIETIEMKRLIWYGHLQRMHDDRWPKKIWNWTPQERRKRGRPPRRWMQDVQEAMEGRNLQEGDWNNRNLWRLRSGKRQRP